MKPTTHKQHQHTKLNKFQRRVNHPNAQRALNIDSNTQRRNQNSGAFTHVDMKPTRTLNEQGLETQPGPAKGLLATALSFFAHTTDGPPINIDDHPGSILITSRNCTSLQKHITDATNK